MANVPRRKVDHEITEPALLEQPAPMIVAAQKKESPSAEEIYRLTQEAAYYKAQARQFAPGIELQDWLEAENEVKQRLMAS
jgi:hypothetical protein